MYLFVFIPPFLKKDNKKAKGNTKYNAIWFTESCHKLTRAANHTQTIIIIYESSIFLNLVIFYFFFNPILVNPRSIRE